MTEQHETRELSPLIRRSQSASDGQSVASEKESVLAGIERIASSYCQFEYTPFLAVIFGLNYGVFIGMVAIPRAYFEAGYVASSFVMILSGILNYICCVYVINMAVRAESIVKILASHGTLVFLLC